MANKRSRADISADVTLQEKRTLSVEYTFDEKEIARKQKVLNFIFKKCEKDGTLNNYDTIKFRGVNYAPGEHIEIVDVAGKRPFVAKLRRIVKAPDFMERLPFIQVEWCLNKHHLPQNILHEYGQHISEAEVFPAPELLYCLYVESIKCKCFILPYDEYILMTSTYEYYYFTRSNFSEVTETISPSPDQWKKECICKMPVNPDRVYVQCEMCQGWFHDSCIENVDLDKTYVCQSCQQENNEEMKKKGNK